MRAFYLKLYTIKSWQASLIIAITGGIVFASGLTSPFQADDLLQIVQSPAVHSIKNIRIFFTSGTFYSLDTSKLMTGSYYRPLMTTTFSLIYTLFGPHPLYFHLVQLLLCIGSSTLLFLFFRYSFTPLLSLFLALIFLMHPLDSNVVYPIPCMQDALFFFFGILALYVLIRLRSLKSLGLVVLCLFLSLLSKETGIVFLGVVLLFLLWWDRKRLFPFIGIMVVPLAVYLALRYHAIGLMGSPAEAPILRLSLGGRLMTAPSIMTFYAFKVLFPLKLSTGYYWVYPHFSVSHFLIPLLIDLLIIAACIYCGRLLHKHASKATYYTYLFFATWTGLGMLTLVQIIPLDNTVSEAWFYVCMAGLLGMIGILLSVFKPPLRPEILCVLGIVLLCTYGVRTTLRGFDYQNPERLAYSNLAASKEDYVADDEIATYMLIDNNYAQATAYARRSIASYPAGINYGILGDIDLAQNNYQGAYNAFQAGLRYGGSQNVLYEGLGKLTLILGTPASDGQLLNTALKSYSHDPSLWLYMALYEERNGNNAQAITAIQNAEKYGQVPSLVYTDIMNNTPFQIYLSGNQSITI